MLYLLVYNNMDEFIDWESGKCSFDGPEFARILEYTKTLPEQYNDDTEEEGEATKLRIASADAIGKLRRGMSDAGRHDGGESGLRRIPE